MIGPGTARQSNRQVTASFESLQILPLQRRMSMARAVV